ncbi:hypothetical protein CK203_077313 [Vitis vinifera]|uniref:F-box/LRR-repeat protein 2 n=1 Tax=Vitis vinifera TaxID=29760 RepID=A0A438EX18_VITVI|nr:hypothetical protein CK203_077313 [Vitis vinifera]
MQLDLCGRCMTLSTLLGTIARSSNCLPALSTMSLRGACRLLNEGIGVLVTSARRLQSLNLGQCSLLTHFSINVVAEVLGHTLKELFIDDCQNINAMLILPALKRLECLEVLSVAGIQTVCDDFISEIVTALGSNMKELVLANCFKITDDSLEAIGRTCSSLSAIDLSNLDLLTDSALHYLANGCRSIQTLRLCRNNFSYEVQNAHIHLNRDVLRPGSSGKGMGSDEAIAAFLETSGQSLKHLSLNHSSKVGDSTAVSLTKCWRTLLTLDLSWCRNLKDEAFGLIVDSCSSLRLLKLFGSEGLFQNETKETLNNKHKDHNRI